MSAAPEGPLEIPEGMFDQAKELADSLPADVSYGVGFKESGGEVTDTVALIVYVPEKKPESELSQEEVIPEEFGGFPVDVIEWKPVPIVDSKAYPKLHGGIEIAPPPTPIGAGGVLVGQSVGTLGAIGRRRSDRTLVLLTASHVVMEGGALVGDIHQPAGGAVVANTGVGTVERHDDGLDCAALEWNRTRKVHATVEDVGEVRGVRVLSATSLTDAERQVAKRGRTTELTTGRITAIKAADGSATTLEIVIAPSRDATLFAWRGDSGSVVLSTGDEVVGLLYAALVKTGTVDAPTETHGIATMINFVQDGLGVDVVGLRPTLKKGAKGGAVRILQEALARAGHLAGAIDGKFGNDTLAAVKQFQRAHIPPADGTVGPNTWDKLVELGHAPPP